MTREALQKEAETARHLVSHFPHDPECETCRIAHLRQAPFHRSVPKDRSKEFQPTKPGQMLSSDALIISRSAQPGPDGQLPPNISAEGHYASICLRDCYSGLGQSYAADDRSTPKIVRSYRHFQGPRFEGEINVVVKSDCAPELIKAAELLKWLPIHSLENRWPHNSVHERWQGTLKSVQRACLFQSGFPVLSRSSGLSSKILVFENTEQNLSLFHGKLTVINHKHFGSFWLTKVTNLAGQELIDFLEKSDERKKIKCDC